MPDLDLKVNWERLDDFFSCLNANTKYVVLRNFESLDKDIVQSAHPDIDILCLNRKEMLSISRSFPRGGNPNDPVHRFIIVNNKKIDVDLRCVGDGYYDTRWEEDILRERVLYNERFYVPSNIHYYYSLLYHVLIQKNKVSDDYITKLSRLAETVNITDNSLLSLSNLEKYMKDNSYFYTYPESPYTIANFDKVDRSLIKHDKKRSLKRNIIKIRRNIEKIIKKLLLWEKK